MKTQENSNKLRMQTVDLTFLILILNITISQESLNQKLRNWKWNKNLKKFGKQNLPNSKK